MRALRFSVVLALALVCATSALGCAHTSWIRLLDARISRSPDGHVVTDVELEAVDTGGGNVGHYCVNVSFFPIAFDPDTTEVAHYAGALDATPDVCDDDLSDGDQRTIRLVSSSATLAAGLPARAQVWLFDVHDDGATKVVVERFETMQGLFTP